MSDRSYLSFVLKGSILMATSTSTKHQVSLKLLIDPKNKKVLFAEAPKEFIDFLFNILCLPIGSVIRLLTKNGMVGCIAELYESIKNLNDAYMLNPKQDKKTLLKPTTSVLNSNYLLLEIVDEQNKPGLPMLYMCMNTCGYNVTDVMNTRCPICLRAMQYPVNRVGNVGRSNDVNDSMVTGSQDKGGFVKGVVTYVVMDNLKVLPLSAISTISLLSKYNINDISSLKEKVVHLGMQEVSFKCVFQFE